MSAKEMYVNQYMLMNVYANETVIVYYQDLLDNLAQLELLDHKVLLDKGVKMA